MVFIFRIERHCYYNTTGEDPMFIVLIIIVSWEAIRWKAFHVIGDSKPSPFSRSSASVYYTERKSKNKNGEAWERGYQLVVIYISVAYKH